ncbi:MAG: metal-dependent transcriptional regulator [Candidatus Heimdallarchaeaceae archaeon]
MTAILSEHKILENLTSSEKQILNFMYRWSRPIRAGDLSSKLSIKHTTLNSQLQLLEEKALILWERYRTVSLTKSGEKIAAHLVRHHRLLESFFCEYLHMDAEEAHIESMRIFPYVSCNLIYIVSQTVEANKICPCGYPIPESDSCVPEKKIR